MIRFAFVGCGKVVEAFHLPALSKIGDVRLTAFIDADLQKAAEEVGIAVCLGKVEGLASLEREISRLCTSLFERESTKNWMKAAVKIATSSRPRARVVAGLIARGRARG